MKKKVQRINKKTFTELGALTLKDWKRGRGKKKKKKERNGNLWGWPSSVLDLARYQLWPRTLRQVLAFNGIDISIVCAQLFGSELACGWF